MDYKIVQTKEQKLIAVVRSFRNEIINDGENHDIPDFWGECHDKKLVEPLCTLRPEGKRDLYGLCSPTKEGEVTFEYGIGVLIDEDTSEFDFEEMKKAGYRIWDVKSGTYVVSDRMIQENDIITVDLSPQKNNIWGDYARILVIEMAYYAKIQIVSRIRNGVMDCRWRNICTKR